VEKLYIKEMKYWGFSDAISYYCLNPYEGFDYATYVDKHKVKSFVKPIIKVAEEYAYFTTTEEIDKYDFDTLPDSFVIKATHGCGWDITVNNDFDKNDAVVKMKKWIKASYRISKEKQYAQVAPGVIIEEYLERDIKYYDFFMFNGKMEFVLFNVDKFTQLKQNFYDREWNLLPFVRHSPNDLITKYDKPENFEEMIETVCQLTEKIGNPPFVRVDIYDINNKLYFGEYTFTPSGGGNPLKPDEYEKKYGSLLIVENHTL